MAIISLFPSIINSTFIFGRQINTPKGDPLIAGSPSTCLSAILGLDQSES